MTHMDAALDESVIPECPSMAKEILFKDNHYKPTNMNIPQAYTVILHRVCIFNPVLYSDEQLLRILSSNIYNICK